MKTALLSVLLVVASMLQAAPISLDSILIQVKVADQLTWNKKYTEALQVYRAVATEKAIQDQSSLFAYLWIKQAENYRKLSHYDSASICLEMANARLNERPQDSTQGHYYYELGNLLQRKKDLPAAKVAHHNAVRLRSHYFGENDLKVIIAVFGLVYDHYLESNKDSMEWYMLQAVRKLDRNPEIPMAERAKRYRSVAALYYNWRQKPDSTVRYYYSALSYYEAAGRENLPADEEYQYLRAHVILANRLLQRARVYEAEKLLLQLDQRFEETPRDFKKLDELEVLALQSWANYFEKINDTDRAQHTNQLLIQRWDELMASGKAKKTAPRSRALAYHRLGYLAALELDYDQAIQQTKQTLDFFIESEDWDEVATVYFELGNYFTEWGKLDSANSYLQKGRTVLQDKALTSLRYLQGDYALFSSKWELQRAKLSPKGSAQTELIHAGLAHLEEAATWFTGVHNPRHPTFFEIQVQKSAAHQQLHAYSAALADLDSAIKITHLGTQILPDTAQILNYGRLVDALTQKGQVLREKFIAQPTDTSELKRALESLRLADRYLDQQSRFLSNESSRRLIRNRLRRLYEEALTVCQLLQETTGESYAAEQFYFMEKSKALSLLERLNDRKARLTAGVGQEWLERENQIKAELQYQTQRLQETDFSLTVRAKIAELNEAYLQFVQELEAAYPAYHQLKYGQSVSSLTALQQSLSAEEALLQFFWGDEQLYALVITPTRTKLYPIDERDRVEEALKIFQAELLSGANRFDPAFLTAGQQLFQSLLAPAREIWQGKQQLILLPDGPLSDLPFEALPLTEGETDCPYLVCELAVSYDYSATVHGQNRERTPAISWWGADALLMAPSPFSIAETGPLSSLANFLPFQEKMAQQTGAKLLPMETATKDYFWKHAAQYDILHLATHGQMDTTHLFSWLAFPNELLYAHEIYNLELDQVQMAVLGACETGLGKREKSEGPMSLARAFSYAGCPAVLMSLWSASARTTFENLLPDFYEFLGQGHSKAEALRQAKLRLIQESGGTHQHPYYWAALVSTGNQAPIALGPQWEWWIGGGVGLLVLVLGTLGVYRRRKGGVESGKWKVKSGK